MSAQNDATFLRMFLLVLGALVAFTVVIMIAANQITGSVDEERGEDPRRRAAVQERIQPIGSVNVAAGAAATTQAAAPRSGADVAAVACNACHVAGVAGAPKIGDTDAWSQRLTAQGGVDGLTSSVINGKGAMPPRGGAQASDEELRAAVVHLLAESGVETDAASSAAAAPAAESAAPATPVEAMQQMAQDAAETAQSMAAAVMPGTEPAEQPAAAAAPAAAADLQKGKSVYGTACFVCHGTGAAGAPKLGDAAAWAARLEQGIDAMYANAINGKGAMPPKGGRLDISDGDIKAAVDYMVDQVQ